MPDTFAEAADGVVMIANGIDPVLRWEGDSEVAEPAGVVAPTTAPTLAATGTGKIVGVYAIFVRFVDRHGNLSNLSPVSNQLTVTKSGSFTYSGIAVPTDPQIARKQILRNTAGQFDVFYVDIDTTSLGDSTFTSTTTDAVLGANSPVPLFDVKGFPLANRYGVPPDTHPFLVFHISRMWFFGHQEYAEGSVQVTLNSVTVQGVGTRWPATFPGRFLYVQGQPGIEIASINVETQTITLLSAYTAPTDKFAQYNIAPPPGVRQLLAYSEAGLPQAVPPQNALSMPEDGDRITGGCQFGSFLYIFKRRRMYRMTAQTDPSTDGFIFYALGRGCVNNRCWQIVEDKMYLMDESGVYATGGGDSCEQLSTPIQNLFRPGDTAAINWGVSRFFHSSFDQAGETIRWFVATASSYLPQTALCLHYPSGKWWTEHYGIPIGASLTARSTRVSEGWGAGTALVFLGGPAGAVYALSGLLDGPPADGPTTRGYATAASIDSLTDSGAAFDTINSVNAPIAIVDGRGQGQYRKIVAATGTRVRVDEPWRILPDTTSQYQIGAIPVKLLSGRMRWAPTEVQSGRSVELQFVPTEADISLDMSINLDFSDRPRLMGRTIDMGQRNFARADKNGTSVEILLDNPAGHFWLRMDGQRELATDAPRLFSFDLEGFSGPDRIVIGEVVLNGAVR